MKSIFWDVAHFTISMKSQYGDLYDLERDISTLDGSSNFLEIDSFDWFLLDRKTKEISFVLLSIPSVINLSSVNELIHEDFLQSVKFSDCRDKFLHDVTIQNSAYFSMKENVLIVTTDSSLVYHKTFVSDDLYFLLGKDLSYQGFLLVNAMSHIPGKKNELDDHVSDSLFLRMFEICDDEFYDSMDEKDKHCLSVITQLENDCLKHKGGDERLLQIIEFTRALKYTFYDMEFE